MKNDYDAVDGLVIRTDKVLSDMTVDAGERETLVNLLKQNFQGDAGSSNGELQDRVKKQIDEYNDALMKLKSATKEVSGVDGMFRMVDIGQGQRFSNIGL